jgi:hypothetical protein
MIKTPINKTARQSIVHLQGELDALRKRLEIYERGCVLYRFDASCCDEEIVLVEADGFGGAVLRVVEGNYPVDYLTREEQSFSTEDEAVKAAAQFSQNVTA